MKTTIQIKVSVFDDTDNLALEVKKQSIVEKDGQTKDSVYCDLFDLVGQLQYDIVEVSGKPIDYFL